MYSIFNRTKLSFRQNRAEGKEQTTANNAVYFDVSTVEGSPINIPTSTEHDDNNHQTQVYENTNTAINDQISDSQETTYQASSLTKCHIACLPYTMMWIKSAQQSHVLLLQYLRIHCTTNL